MNRAEYSKLPKDLQKNLDTLVWAVNALLADLISIGAIEAKPVKVSSGFRTPDLNKAIGGAKMSYHMRCLAVDLVDNSDQDLAHAIATHPELLKKHGLWLEHPDYTKGKHTNWVHLDLGTRTDRPSRVFVP